MPFSGRFLPLSVYQHKYPPAGFTFRQWPQQGCAEPKLVSMPSVCSEKVCQTEFLLGINSAPSLDGLVFGQAPNCSALFAIGLLSNQGDLGK